MPSSLQARNTRSAISPRLAMRTFENMFTGPRLFDDDKRITKFYWLAVFNQDFNNLTGLCCRNLIHCFHSFNDQQCLTFFNSLTNFNKCI
mmetsp:Transcript_11952/g.15794  ORF Transcript_11952/g.15794 Transcript_11952/m.15794 type:complete len:90 (-) Transcript_11952:25-294(-)